MERFLLFTLFVALLCLGVKCDRDDEMRIKMEVMEKRLAKMDDMMEKNQEDVQKRVTAIEQQLGKSLVTEVIDAIKDFFGLF